MGDGRSQDMDDEGGADDAPSRSCPWTALVVPGRGVEAPSLNAGGATWGGLKLIY